MLVRQNTTLGLAGWSTGLVLEAFRTKQFYTDDVISHLTSKNMLKIFLKKSITKGDR